MLAGSKDCGCSGERVSKVEMWTMYQLYIILHQFRSQVGSKRRRRKGVTHQMKPPKWYPDIACPCENENDEAIKSY